MSSYPDPGDAFGRYDVGGVLGRGGMGVVFRAVHRDLQRPVALKVMSPLLVGDPVYRARFLREAQVLARLDSPYVVRVHDAGDQDGRLFIATELLEGGDLQQRLSSTGAPPVDVALRLAGEAARGLADAHAAGVLHRDLKPSNVLLRPGHDGGDGPGATGTAVLCDLGIAKTHDDAHVTTAFVGTPAYMAPERHDGHPASVASDVYELGCVLVALLTGVAPYRGTLSQVAIAHLHAPVPRLPGDDPLTRDLNVVLARALAKDPAARYASAAELGRAVDAVRSRLSLPGPAPAPRRRRLSTGLVTALVTGLVAALATVVVAVVLARRPSSPPADAADAVHAVGAADAVGAVVAPQVGECHDLAAADLERSSLETTDVDCSTATARTVRVGRLRTRSDTELGRAGATCWRPTVQALGVSPERYATSVAGFAYFRPTDTEWAAGARWLRCDLVLDDGGTLLPVPSDPRDLFPGGGPVGPAYVACLDLQHVRVGCERPGARFDLADTFTLPDRTRPARRVLLARAGATCPAAAGPGWYATWPSATTWRAGYRVVTCWRPRR